MLKLYAIGGGAFAVFYGITMLLRGVLISRSRYVITLTAWMLTKGVDVARTA